MTARRSFDRWTRRPRTSGYYAALHSAAIDSCLAPWAMVKIGDLQQSLSALEEDDPSHEANPIVALPYSIPKEAAKDLGHHNGIAIWSDFFDDQGAMFLGVIQPIDMAAWYFVPAAAMPPADRRAVIEVTKPEPPKEKS